MRDAEGRKPSFKQIKVWGCPAYIKKTKVEKLDARSLKEHFVGYRENLMGYLFYLHDVQQNILPLQAHFFEDEFI